MYRLQQEIYGPHCLNFKIQWMKNINSLTPKDDTQYQAERIKYHPVVGQEHTKKWVTNVLHSTLQT
jgi:hypothetical protein